MRRRVGRGVGRCWGVANFGFPGSSLLALSCLPSETLSFPGVWEKLLVCAMLNWHVHDETCEPALCHDCKVYITGSDWLMGGDHLPVTIRLRASTDREIKVTRRATIKPTLMRQGTFLADVQIVQGAVEMTFAVV
jgi:hypothetical protein